LEKYFSNWLSYITEENVLIYSPTLGFFGLYSFRGVRMGINITKLSMNVSILYLQIAGMPNNVITFQSILAIKLISYLTSEYNFSRFCYTQGN
jgi:hypothetical protein